MRAFGTLPGMPAITRGHCEVGRLLAERLGPVGAGRVRGMTQVFERWDGEGRARASSRARRSTAPCGWPSSPPTRRRRTACSAPTGRSPSCARAPASGYDPKLVELFCRHAPQLFAALDVPSVPDAVLAAEPGEPERLSGERAGDGDPRPSGEYADIKSRYTRGHSAGVAALAARAAERLRARRSERRAGARRAPARHRPRRASSCDIWDKPGPLTETEWERVRMHTYFTERMLARLDALAPAPAIAALAHERLDGSGYHRRLPAVGACRMAARLLAAADAYHAMTEARPTGRRCRRERAAEQLRREARAGRFDRDAVDAVLAAAGQPGAPARRNTRPG